MKTVFVNGTFDVLHPGHMALLNYAKSLGYWLVVGIDSDQRVKQLKGHNRPINNEVFRKTMLENVRPVDQVIIFNSDAELVNLIAQYDIMVKGSDYQGKPIVGQDVCPELVFFKRVNDFSTTQIIKDIVDRR